MTNTILYAAETTHQGKLVHVMGYQNRATNLEQGPNAMLLPIPSDVEMGPDNMLDTTMAKNVLKDYATAVRNAEDRLSRGMKGFGADARRSRSVQVFDKGSFTVALADSAKDLTAALGRIPENKRPPVNADIFTAYDKLYPGWKMALCAWDGTLEAEPLLWWYEPKDAGQLFMPALDAHDGHAPKIGSEAHLDHTLIVASVTAPPKDATDVHFQDVIPDHLKPFLATKVSGEEMKLVLANGDFAVRISSMQAGHGIRRIPPPGVLSFTGALHV